MKNLLFFSFCLLFCIACGSNNESQPAKKSTSPNKANVSGITDLATAEYKTALDKSLESMPIDRLCKESKGYNMNEWEGTNACAWAVEKFRIEQTKGLVERKEGTLSLQLVNGAIELAHPVDQQGTNKLFYQFKGYADKANVFYLEVFREGQCPSYWMINRNDGSKMVLKGLPVFNSQQDAFMLSTAYLKSNECGQDLELWELENGKFVKTWTTKPDKGVYDLLWTEDSTWYGVHKVTTSVKITPK